MSIICYMKIKRPDLGLYLGFSVEDVKPESFGVNFQKHIGRPVDMRKIMSHKCYELSG